MFISKELLEKHGACKDHLDKFVELFPDGVDATRALCLAHAQTFDFTWAYYLLSRLARTAYDEAVGPARKAYNEAIAPAWEAYAGDTAAAWKAYDEVLASEGKVYDETVAAARKVYNEAVAPAWFDASQKE